MLLRSRSTNGCGLMDLKRIGGTDLVGKHEGVSNEKSSVMLLPLGERS